MSKLQTPENLTTVLHVASSNVQTVCDCQMSIVNYR